MTDFDLSSPQYVSNPYPTYQRLHQEAPVYFCSERGFYYVSRYDDVQAIFRHAGASSNRVKPMAGALPKQVRAYAAPLIESLEKWVLFLDAPEHARIRRAINPAFSPKVVADLQPRIKSLSNELLKECKETESVELISDFAYPLPVLVIAEMLGCAPEDRQLLKAWSDQIAAFLGNKTTLESAGKARDGIIDATAYFQEVLARHRKNPKDNLLNNLLAFQAENPKFSDDHLIANCIALIFAGHETTTNLIANTALCLLQHPHFIPECANDDFLGECIEEALRYESPVQRIGRFSQTAIEIAGAVIPPESRILLMIGAANRDVSVFDSPDAFDPMRKGKHLAFGYGHHLCSGASVARQEALIGLQVLFDTLRPNLVEDFKPQWQYNLGLRALEDLPILRG